ncbi:hypothetical protein ACFQ61_36910 [Streptomyces sp. NPDC056500]|uniref:hypothetical protein n=1 Tax=Streptomyces sp. NPDC056500 TaxID=3345840 RepID=UPI0036C9EB23
MQNKFRAIAVSVAAAVAFGVAAPVATATTQGSPSPAVTGVAHADAQRAANGVLQSTDAQTRAIVARLTATERAQLQGAGGSIGAQGISKELKKKLKRQILKIISRYPGLHQALTNVYRFMEWYSKLPRGTKFLVKRIAPWLTVVDIFFLLNDRL